MFNTDRVIQWGLIIKKCGLKLKYIQREKTAVVLGWRFLIPAPAKILEKNLAKEFLRKIPGKNFRFLFQKFIFSRNFWQETVYFPDIYT